MAGEEIEMGKSQKVEVEAEGEGGEVVYPPDHHKGGTRKACVRPGWSKPRFARRPPTSRPRDSLSTRAPHRPEFANVLVLIRFLTSHAFGCTLELAVWVSFQLFTTPYRRPPKAILWVVGCFSRLGLTSVPCLYKDLTGITRRV